MRPGDILAGKYRVERVLGIGGMGAVVAAHHLQLGERVALKFLLPEALTSAEAVGRFVREARAAVRIKSEHVARVSDVGQLENGAPYIVMEYLDGTDLAGWLRQWGPLPVEQAVEFVLQACVAIADAHGLGIVHRDLKPANLFCTRRSDGQLVVKVLDFGISKLTDGAPSEPGAMAATRTSAVMGSPLYMSPEQFRSAKTVDARTDIWSLGVILFELLSGVVPFQGEGFGELAVKIATQDALSLGSHRPDVPPELEGVVSRCLEKDRERRYSNVAELATALLPFAPQPRGRALAERIVGIIQAAGTSGGAAASLSAPPVSVPPPSPMSVGPLGPTRPPSAAPEARPQPQASSVTPWSAPSEGRAGKLAAGGAAMLLVLAALGVGGVFGVRRMLQPRSSPDAGTALDPPPPPPGDVAVSDAAVLACVPGSTRCAQTTPQTCTPAGQWVTGAVTAEQCGAECTPGSSPPRCDGATPETCGKTGVWERGTPCARSTVCRSGACAAPLPGPQPRNGGAPPARDAGGKDHGPLVMQPM